MFCTHCEFEIKGDDRKECPVCGGPLIDYSEVKTSSEEITSAVETDRWQETPNAERETLPFDLGKAIEGNDEHPVQEPEEPLPLYSPVEPEPQSEARGEERSAEDVECTDFDKSRLEKDRWEETPNEEKERLPFDLGKAIEGDDEHPVQEPEEHFPLYSPVEPEPQSETRGEERSPEDAECTDFDKSRWEETPNEEKETLPFDLGKAIEGNDEHPVQEPEEPLPLYSPVEPEPQSEARGEERSAEDVECTDFDKSRLEKDRWEETPNEEKERLPFDLGKAIETDNEHPVQEPEEPAPLLSQSETALEPGAADTPRSTEEVVPNIPDSYDTLPEEIIAAVQQTEPSSTHASRKQLALSIMGVLALVAAITTIAIFKPQQNLYPDIGHLKTKTEKTVGKILSIITQKEEKKVVAQKPSAQSTRFQQRQKDHAAGNVDPDMKPSTKKTLERKTVLATPVVKETSQTSLYSLHSGSFKNKEVAAGERDRLKRMGFHAYLQTVDLENGQTWHRIKVGSYSTREEAENTQNELRQKVPKLKSYIMRRVTEPQKTATKREGEKSIGTAGITPFVSGQAQKELPHEKPNVLETAPPLKKTLTPEGEPPITEMQSASYLTFPSGEAPQVVLEGGEVLPLLKENFVPEIEQLIAEMEGNPFTALLLGEAIPQADAGSIGTIPDDTHQKEDHPSTGNTVPEDMVHEGKEAVTPIE